MSARVLIVGSGLIGTSVGLALRATGTEVSLTDIDPDFLDMAVEAGAGEAWHSELPDPDIVVVAVPPRLVADEVAHALQRWPGAVVTDVASVKGSIVADVDRRSGPAAARFIGGHPMAGREVAGPSAAVADLFRDRPWVLTPTHLTEPQWMETVLELVASTGAIPIELDPGDHDRAVALTSHAPQVLASLLAGRLNHADPEQVLVSGQGLRDTVRIAGSDPVLWSEILAANAGAVVDELRCLAGDLQRVIGDLEAGGDAARGGAYRAVEEGRRGVARLPGKHGAAADRYRAVRVAVPDEPGALAGLFAAVAAAGVNLEDVRIEHALGRPTGLVELSVAPRRAPVLSEALQAAGWSLRP